MAKVFDVEAFLQPEWMAVHINNLWRQWKDNRDVWEREHEELRKYIFATDTKFTSGQTTPWKNSTTTPKLCQIRDNLHANYMAALFPRQKWMKWYGSDKDSVDKDKAKAIESFMQNKLTQISFEEIVSDFVYDYIDYGNVFGDVTFIHDRTEDPETGEVITNYSGPMAYRLSPFDHVFDITATDYKSAPKITRYIKSLGQLAKEAKSRPELGFYQEVVDKIRDNRSTFAAHIQADAFQEKNYGNTVDGFNRLEDYYNSGWVELLEFQGDIYDHQSGELLEDYVVTVVDRSYVIRKEKGVSWLGSDYKHHVSWRKRPDNLMGMGPLDNLVGMQYRIDHLENLKADVFDQIAFPMMKIRGNVDDFDYVPGQKIYLGDDGDVEFLNPDATALNADTQIAILENKMEEMAGAPKQAMGFRTPGEKTAYEVQSLESAASRIFQAKVSHFERVFLEPLVNDMFEIARRNMGSVEQVPVIDEETGATLFLEIEKEDITARGKLRPMGARHFAETSKMLQEINNFANSALGQDPAVNVHISGKKIAEMLFNDVFKLEHYGIVEDNIRVFEQMETQEVMQSAQETADVNASTNISDEEELM